MTLADAKPQPVRPMEATAPDACQPGVVTKQPSPQPQPQATAAQDVSMRGGNLGVSCNICHGHMSFYKSCC